MAKVPRHTLASVIGGKLTASNEKKLARETAAYLLSERRSGELDSLLRDVEQYRADNGVVEVVAVSAFPLDAKAHKEVEAKIRSVYPKANQIMITQRIDANQLAGVRLELANQQLDLTIRTKLNQFKQRTSVHGTA
jgi:F0F1-type ATP synthase delta subunit